MLTKLGSLMDIASDLNFYCPSRCRDKATSNYHCLRCHLIVSRLFEYLMVMKYTAKQGQYLAFIYYYTKIHRRAPAESDLQEYFRVSPPSVHQMILNLEKEGFIERVPGQGRSIQLLLRRDQLPDLE